MAIKLNDDSTSSSDNVRVAILCRVSTKKQLDPSENGGDIPTQQKACHDFVNSKPGWKVVKNYEEKGVSGYKKKSSERDVIRRVLYDAENGEFDVLLVFMFDRIGRREDETPLVLQTLVRYGVKVWSVTEGEQKFDNHVDKLIAYVRAWQAEGESYKTAVRVDETHRQMVEEGRFRGGGVPFGYRTKPSGKLNKKGKELLALEIDPEQAEIVRKMYQLTVEEGYGQNRIAQYLNQQGFKTNNNKPWSSSVVSSLLKHVLYKGYFQYAAGTDHEVYSKEKQTELAIVDEAAWSRAQDIRAKRNSVNTKKEEQECVIRSTKGSLLLVGMARCGHCGNALTTTWNKKIYKRNDGTTRYARYAKYRCSGKALRKIDCNGQTVHSQFKLESIVLDEVHTYLDRLLTVDLTTKIEELKQRNVDNEEKEIRKINKKLDAQRNNLSKFKAEVIKVISGESKFSDETLNGLIEETKRNIHGLEEHLHSIQTQIEHKMVEKGEVEILQKYVPVWREVFERASNEKKKMMLSTIIGCVRVFRDQIEIDYKLHINQFLNTLGYDAVNQEHSHGSAVNDKVLTGGSVAMNA